MNEKIYTIKLYYDCRGNLYEDIAEAYKAYKLLSNAWNASCLDSVRALVVEDSDGDRKFYKLQELRGVKKTNE